MIDLNMSYILETMLKSTIFLGISAGILGVFISYQRRSMEINAVSAGAWTGMLAVIILLDRFADYISISIADYIYSYAGAAIGSIAVIILLSFLYKTARLDMQIIQSIVTAVILGFGIVLVTYINRSGGALNSGIETMFFGETTSLVREEYMVLLYTSIFVIIVTMILYSRLKVIVFDEDLARTTRFNISFYKILMNVMLIALIISAIKIMGVFLTISVFLIPAMTARLWSSRMAVIVILSGILGAVSGGAGSLSVSYDSSITSGVAVTLAASILFFISLILAPKGILGNIIKGRNK